MAFVGLGGRGVEGEFQPLGGTAMSGLRCGQGRLFFGGQRPDVPGEIVRGPAFAHQAYHVAAATGRRALRMAALQLGLQSCAARVDPGAVSLAVFAARAFLGRAVDEDQSGGDLFVRAGIAEGVAQHRQLVMSPRQGGVVLPPPPLLDGQKAGVLPKQVLGVGVVDGSVVLPLGGAHGGIAVAV